MSDPIHILVAHPSERRLLSGVSCHVLPSGLEGGGLLKMPGMALSVGPELAFLLAANELSLPRLLELGYEFCGHYRLNPGSPTGFDEAPPLTSPSKLGAFVEKAGGARGTRAAKRALAYLRANSRSPMETVITALLCLPPRLGGYGLPLPYLNYRVNVPKDGRKAASNRYYLCDMFWPDARLDVEYDSDREHTGPDRIAADAKRRNGLASLGITVIAVTKQQAFNCDAMDEVAHGIAKQLGRRLRMGGKDWVKARADLRRQLLGFALGNR